MDEWLAGLGLGEYASRFAENDIDFTVLPDLTDQDLEKIGVASLGHRRKLLRAIAALDAAPPSSTAAPVIPTQTTAAVAPPPISAAADAAGERRYLTVMFCDLVGSTGISAQLDAEEWRDLVGAYLDAASAAVTGMGGHVAKKLGDGLMSLFGYPVAQENDAERGARAALAIQRALAALNRKNAGTGKPELVARIGLETGPAVVDAAGEIYGDVANIAARVQALAEPGAVLVTARVQRQIAGLFVAEERGTHTLKGVPEPTALFRLVRASGGGRRSGARNLTALVGRDDEITMLTRRWERARQGDGQLVMIVGEPGLGKSRLIEEFHVRLADTPHTWVEWSCSQLLQNTPLHPIAEWGRQRFGGNDVPAERRLAELEGLLAQVKLDPAENVPLLGSLLDIPLPKERAPALAPEELRRRQLAALSNWVIAGAKVQPVVLAFEDLHWADPTTLDVLRGIAERGALAPLFILATTRPEFRPPWSMRSHHGTISLAPLDRAQVHDMVAELAARHALPRDVVEDVAARTGGVPLFVEEVTRLLLERGEQGGIHVIPPTLQQSLMARLDRLGPAREVAQIGSVIGRGFSYGLLHDVAGMEDAPLQAALEKLADADIVLVQGLPPDSDYRFKHALIQDAAYENLLKSRRQVLHRRVAEILRDRFADTAAAEPEALAYHFTQAGMTDAAIEWWGKAGDQALRRSAFQEAIAHLGKAIAMADKEGEGAPRAAATPATASVGQRLKLQTSYGQALMWSKGYASEETKAAVSRAQELAGNVDDPSERFATYYGQWAGHLLRAELNSALETATAFLRDAENAGRPTEAAVAQRFLGLTILWQSDFIEARARLNEALRIYDSERDHDAKFHFGTDTGAVATVHLAQANWLLGNVDQARELMQEAVTRAGATTHAPTVTNVDYFRAVFEVLRGDTGAALRTADSLLKLTRQHGLSVYATLGTMCSGWARAQLGDCEAGVAEFREALATYTGQGNKGHVPLHQALLAELEADVQDMEAALTRMDAALALAGETGEHWTDSFLHRIRGEILLKRDPANTVPAEEAFLTAIAVAQEQKARSFELRAALSLAKLYQSSGRAADAHAVLAPPLESFAPTPEFPEIKQAQTLLAALAVTDEVKNAAASRQRRLKLQTSYGQALLWSKGFGAEETKVALTRAKELAAGIGDAAERFPTYYGLWLGSITRGEWGLARETAEIFLHETKTAGRLTEAAVASRNLGLACLWQGHFVAARTHLEEALRIYDPERDREAKFRFGWDSGVGAMAFLAQANWLLGEVGRARELIEEAAARAVESAHVPTQANLHHFKALFEIVRGDAGAARREAEITIGLSQEHRIPLFLAIATLSFTCARARLGDETGTTELRQTLQTYTDQGNKMYVPFFQGHLAELEAEQGAEGALSRIDAALALAGETGEHLSDAFLHRIRGEILLKRDPADTAPAEEAFLTAIAVAQEQKARSFGLRAALALARLYQSTNRAADAHAVLAPALEGFTPTPEFREIEEARTLLAALAESEEVKNAAAARQRRLKLQTSYGKAMMLSRGFASEESKIAFTRAYQLGKQIGDAEERFDTYYGLFISKLVRGEIAAARETAEAFRREAEGDGRMTEVAAASRALGVACLYQGALDDAQTHLSEALRLSDQERDRDAKFRFGADTGVAASYLAQTEWYLGEIDRALELIEESVQRAAESGHVPTLALAYHLKGMLDMQRGDVTAALRDSEALVELTQEHPMALYHAHGSVHASWARARLGEGEAGIAEFERAIAVYADQGAKLYLPFYLGFLAELEGERRSADGALTRIDEALALSQQTGTYWIDSFLHRIRGEILLKCDPANTAPAEEAFRTAIAVAQKQKARSFELRAALSLAKLYQSTKRAVVAHAVLAPALEGFSPTPKMPEIVEAQTLLAALAETDEVKTATAQRQRRLKLQTSYGQAMMWSKGYAAPETAAAFARAQELTAGGEGTSERFVTYYGQAASRLWSGDLSSARQIAANMLRDAGIESQTPEALAAYRIAAFTSFCQGNFTEARTYSEEALKIDDSGWDRDAKLRFGQDSRVAAMVYLANANWQLGDVRAAHGLMERGLAVALETGHVPTLAFTYALAGMLDLFGGDADAALRHADAVAELSREHQLSHFQAIGHMFHGWACARLGDRAGGLAEIRGGLAAFSERGTRLLIPWCRGLIAELEAEGQEAEKALIQVDQALALADETGERWTEALLHRIRGEILLKLDPANTAPAEEAFRTAIAVAREQKAKSFELRAALSLAKLCQSTNRGADAHAVLAPALEGFAPTPEFPEIAEARALLATLAE